MISTAKLGTIFQPCQTFWGMSEVLSDYTPVLSDLLSNYTP